MYIDVHAHYDDNRFKKDRDQVLSNMKNENVGLIINAGADLKTSEASLALSEKYDFIYAACGIHPHEARYYKEQLPKVEKLLDCKKCVAVGETGLDYHYENSKRQVQKESFKAHIDMAVKHDMPIVIHNREAFEDCIEIVKEYKNSGIKGLIHCFSGSRETAKIFLDAGYYLSIGGVVTFKNARKIVDTVKYMPLDRLLTETDSPYLSPEPKRGKRNDSTHIKYIIQKIAEIKGVKQQAVLDAVYKNTKELFKL